jgi:hypothetical protein
MVSLYAYAPHYVSQTYICIYWVYIFSENVRLNVHCIVDVC